MPSATWRGSVSFGLVAIPVRMYLATESHGVSFRMLCASCGAPIQNRRWCPQEEKLIDWGDVERGYEVGRGQFVEVTDRDLELLPLPSTDTIEVLQLVTAEEVDSSLVLDKAYYLEPEPSGMRPYALLREALAKTSKVAIGKVALRQREHLCRISPHDRVLVLNTLRWPDEVRSSAFLRLPDENVETKKRELDMAVTLIDNLTAPFHPEQYRDEYAEALAKVVEAKTNRKPLPPRRVAAQPDNVVDLMAALKAAVEQTSSGPHKSGRARARRATAARSTSRTRRAS